MHSRTSRVLIVGGGPVGLALSILLSRNEIDNCLVETRPRTSPQSARHLGPVDGTVASDGPRGPRTSGGVARRTRVDVPRSDIERTRIRAHHPRPGRGRSRGHPRARGDLLSGRPRGDLVRAGT
ncbi:hypothetical protein E7742_07850 [Rhodococcus sp. SGAir0479]|nr:hypothetical protein E7742_07850 [Rhodococcus sp. SGAir0479]